MAMLANWRTKLPSAALLLGVLSLAVGGALYLVFDRLDRPVIIFLGLGAALLAIYIVEDYASFIRFVTGRGARYGGNTAAMILIFLAILGVLNFISARHSYRLDLTAAREFSLSPQTVKVLQSLSEPVHVKAFFRGSDFGRAQAQDLLKEYQRQSGNVHYEFIDWEERPGEAMAYKLQTFPVLVMEAAGRRQDVTDMQEQGITSAIFKVARGAPRKVAFTTGHGEPDLNGMADQDIGQARQALEDSNYLVQSINLAAIAAVPDDVTAIVIDAPKTPLLAQEKTLVKEFLDRGGKVMLLAAPKRSVDMTDLVQAYGLAFADGIVVDAGQALQRQPYVPVISSFPDFSPVTRELANGGQAVITPMSTQISVTQQLPEGVEVARLLQTTPDSWLATNEKDINYHTGDLRGPLTLGVTASAPAKTPLGQPAEGSAGQSTPSKTRLVAFGTADFVSNAALDALANRQLFVNAVNWLTEEEDLINIRPEPPVDRTLTLTSTQANLLIYSCALFLPLAVAAFGAFVWWGRR